MKKWPTPLDEILPALKTGDIILMHGKFPFSWAIEAVEGSLYSHVGMILLASEMGFPAGTPEYLLWEANSLTDLPDLWGKRNKTGPMIVDLVKRLKDNSRNFRDSRFAVRHLVGDRGPDYSETLKKFISQVHQAEFPTDLEMLRFLIEGREEDRASPPDKYFCSELVAASLMAMGLLTRNFPPNAFEPKDFSRRGTVTLLRRCFFGEEHFVNV